MHRDFDQYIFESRHDDTNTNTNRISSNPRVRSPYLDNWIRLQHRMKVHRKESPENCLEYDRPYRDESDGFFNKRGDYQSQYSYDNDDIHHIECSSRRRHNVESDNHYAQSYPPIKSMASRRRRNSDHSSDEEAGIILGEMPRCKQRGYLHCPGDSKYSNSKPLAKESSWSLESIPRARKKKPVCKFCATSKYNGSCPCPIHLPAVRSRYLTVLKDSSRNAITINVFKNGENRETPSMIHIPKFHMCSLEDIMYTIDRFIRFPVGYAYALYTVLGDLVEDPSELEPYETYVVVTNCKKQFIQMDYGNKKPSAISASRRRRIPPSFMLSPYFFRRK